MPPLLKSARARSAPPSPKRPACPRRSCLGNSSRRVDQCQGKQHGNRDQIGAGSCATILAARTTRSPVIGAAKRPPNPRKPILRALRRWHWSIKPHLTRSFNADIFPNSSDKVSRLASPIAGGGFQAVRRALGFLWIGPLPTSPTAATPLSLNRAEATSMREGAWPPCVIWRRA